MLIPIYILSAAALGPCGDIQQTERKILAGDVEHTIIQDTLETLTGLDMRRVGHFCETALVGSVLTIKRLKNPLDPNSHVYFGTGLGEVQKTMSIFKQTLDSEGDAVSPYSFINSIGSTTSFYIAKTAGLKSRSITACQDELSFEWALKLACNAIEDKDTNSAMAGGADEFSVPHKEHRRRLLLDDEQIMGEGSGWLYLSGERDSAIGEVIEVRYLPFTGADDAHKWAREVSNVCKPYLAGKPPFLLPGFRVNAGRLDALTKAIPGVKVRRYLDYCGCFHTAAAFAVASVFDMPHKSDSIYLHVNSDIEGRTMAVVFKAYGIGGGG